ncbi:GTP-binding protein [Umezawaea endophytica]|uniref:TetM/TetW/TetO/TetS family tetracycline resistance ribosomal protection protein n=1 Tax=Umezawaea endophytica TaxID=1654476 RepID=A0A9X3ADT2_9PSEU|nr:TetM/TetW/TetO/TetS family tetracycline resistance ribosomal protection protein [Umezawaea endophytica]MCS7476026.1 TetM/TetW/TetO/TetS family tetracycline resistance ribosomal protection protein [Umezawaea endophytica]
MKTVNIGILAHVDAGKTSLTERLLHATGVIDHVGSVDRGDTQTDTDDLERRRGITIRSAVVSFTVDDVKVNLIDTPGHPDFISEVERALAVLDGVVLVVSAVEGVQAHTRLLMRTLARLGMPVVVFVNKIDRRGARYLVNDLRLLAPGIVPLGTVSDIGCADASPVPRGFAADLAEHDDTFLARYLDTTLTYDDCRAELARQSTTGRLHPVFFGSAVTGAGIPELVDGITRYFPLNTASDGLRATVFKIDRDGTAYVRLHSGTLAARTQVDHYRGEVRSTGRVVDVAVFDHGARARPGPASTGDIAKVRGLRGIRIGDQLGGPHAFTDHGLFAPPTLETVVTSPSPGLYEALERLSEQDPFINVRKGADIVVSLYGEVQKEVIAATLLDEYGIAVDFAPTTVVCVENPSGTGESLHEMGPSNPFVATIGLRVEPGPGRAYGLEVELGCLPLAFHKAVEDTVLATLDQGLHGWAVHDVRVTLTHAAYSSPVSVAADFRNLTPLVLLEALRRAGTTVLEPVAHFDLEVPADTAGPTLAALAAHGAIPETVTTHHPTCLVDGTIPLRTIQAFTTVLPGLSHGSGVLVSRFDNHRPVAGVAPRRPRTDGNPLDSKEYLLHVVRRV